MARPDPRREPSSPPSWRARCSLNTSSPRCGFSGAPERVGRLLERLALEIGNRDRRVPLRQDDGELRVGRDPLAVGRCTLMTSPAGPSRCRRWGGVPYEKPTASSCFCTVDHAFPTIAGTATRAGPDDTTRFTRCADVKLPAAGDWLTTTPEGSDAASCPTVPIESPSCFASAVAASCVRPTRPGTEIGGGATRRANADAARPTVASSTIATTNGTRRRRWALSLRTGSFTGGASMISAAS